MDSTIDFISGLIVGFVVEHIHLSIVGRVNYLMKMGSMVSGIILSFLIMKTLGATGVYHAPFNVAAFLSGNLVFPLIWLLRVRIV